MSRAKLLFLVLVSSLVVASAGLGAAEEQVMLPGWPNLWVPKSRVTGETGMALPAERSITAEEQVMLPGLPNLWVPKSRIR